MTATLPRLLLSFCILTIIFSCNQISTPMDKNTQNPPDINTLITRGKKYQTAHIDSLLPIAEQLIRTSKATANKTALVYGELFTAHYYWQSGNHQKSMEAAVKCLADAEKWNIKEAYAEIYLIIGNLHKENANYKMAFDAQEKGLSWAKNRHDTASIISLLNLRAMFIHTYRLLNGQTPDIDTSINIQLATLKMAESNIKYERLRIPLYDNISQYYLNNKDYNKAIYYGEKGATTALKFNQQRSLTYSYSWLGEAYYFKGNKEKGLDYLNKALSIAFALKQPYREMEIYEHFYDCYYSSSHYKDALSAIMRSHKLRDSLQVSVNEKQISELEIKYESAKKDKKIAFMGHSDEVKNRQIILILAGSLLFVIFSIILVLQYRILYRDNNLIKKSNVEKDLALENIAYIQAHELRKPVASIMGLINLIKAMDYEVDKEAIVKLEEASKELDTKIRSIITHVETD